MNPSYILFLLLVLLLTVVLLSIYYRLALRFALQVIDPQRMALCFVRRWSATSWTPIGWI